MYRPRQRSVRAVRVALLALPGLCALPFLHAQSPAPTPVVQKPLNTLTDDPFYSINHVDWPAPSRVRSAQGTPGPDYWQQRADYAITATLDTTTRTVTGTVRIHYTNNSPDTLHYVWLQLDQNLYAPGSKGSVVFASESRWGVRNFQGGYTLSGVRVDGKSATYHVDDTMMRLLLDTPLKPHGSATTITIGFSFRVPDHGSDRMGRDGTLYEIAQWYPRMAVYDDVRGWNTEPYLGQGEFYLEYGDIDYQVTVPAGYIVAGSGSLQNANRVLTSAQRERLTRAARDTTVVAIITADEAAAREKAQTPGTKTWHFTAKTVRDVAWAAAPDFRWDATSTGPIGGNRAGVLCQAYYQVAKAGTAWTAAAEQTQFSIRHYSQLIVPYPYPQATSVAGPVGGMEYPMFVMVHYAMPKDDPTSIFRTVDHELGHQWFPMLVGSNERRYAWMDEGINMYINVFANELRYAPRSTAGKNSADTQRAMEFFPYYLKNWRDTRDRGLDVPIMTAPDRINLMALGSIGYRKPGAVLHTLRSTVVGKATFDSAFKAYARAWSFKHPTPADFFRAVENYYGADLSWYWRDFFYSNKVLDMGLEGVQKVRDSAGVVSAVVTLKNVTGVIFPVTLRVKHASGKVEDLRLPVEILGADGAPGNTAQATIVENGDAVVGIRLWPDPAVPDWNRSNDTWGDAPAANPMHLMTR